MLPYTMLRLDWSLTMIKGSAAAFQAVEVFVGAGYCARLVILQALKDSNRPHNIQRCRRRRVSGGNVAFDVQSRLLPTGSVRRDPPAGQFRVDSVAKHVS
nr:unnamed protein product [Callosobruchus analis]